MNEPLSELKLVPMPLSALRPYERNARTHSKRQIRQIAASIKEFGFTNPVLIDKEGTIIAGHGRVEAAKLLGIGEVPTIRLENLSPEQIRAYVIADNRLAEIAGWDKSILAIELQTLMALDLDFDVTITGFEVPEIDLILQENEPAKDALDEFEVDPSLPAISRPGDLWQLNEHRILCGSALEDESFATLMGADRARAVFTDPPYNVKIDGNVCGKGSIQHREFAMAAGEMSSGEFTDFLGKVVASLARYSTDGSLHYICMDWRHIRELSEASRRVLGDPINLCVWVKDNGGMGSLYRSQHELVFVFKNGQAAHINNVQLGKFGRYRTNVWEYPGVNTLSKQGEEGNLLALHPTVKPVALVADALLDSSVRGDLVLDAFLGSGTTLLAAERVGRICRGLELDPIYVDTAIRRWQRMTGGEAIRSATGESFSELEVDRD